MTFEVLHIGGKGEEKIRYFSASWKPPENIVRKLTLKLLVGREKKVARGAWGYVIGKSRSWVPMQGG